MQISTIGLDIAKNVFQVHGIDATEQVVVRKQIYPRGALVSGLTIARTRSMKSCASGLSGRFFNLMIATG